MIDSIEIKNLNKSFGNIKVLNGVSFKVKEGSITGLIGRNGAGKTTLLKIIMGLIKKDSGEIYIEKKKIDENQVNLYEKIGYMPEDFSLYPNMTGWQIIKYNQGFFQKINIEKVKKYSELLKFDLDKKIKGLSRGSKQVLSFILATSTDPSLLLLDEPIPGLDNIAREKIFKVFAEECNENNTTILYSSNILYDVERIADSLVIINSGTIQFSGNLDELKEQRKKILAAFKRKVTKDEIRSVESVIKVEPNLDGFIIDCFGNVDKAVKDLERIGLRSKRIIDLNLRDIFNEVIKGEDKQC